jgi:hypothetical protein
VPKRDRTFLARTPMLALTVRQPWAWAIMAGWKRVENRSWRTAVRGRIYVHAGRLDDAPGLDSFRGICEPLHVAPPPFETLPTRAIIGSVEIVDCVPFETISDPWASGPWCFVLRDPHPCRTILARGYSRFWEAKCHIQRNG